MDRARRVIERRFSRPGKSSLVMSSFNGDVLRTLAPLTLLLSCAGCPGGSTPVAVDLAVDLASAPAVPGVTVMAKVPDCAPLAGLPEGASAEVRALRPAAEAARAVSCAPEVFGMSDADALAALKIPSSVQVGFSRDSARIQLVKGADALDLAAALGLESPKMKAEQGSRHINWRLVTGEGSNAKLWGVGELSVFVMPPGRVAADPDEILPIPPGSTVRWDLMVAMPEGTLSFDADPAAAAAVTNALLEIANEPSVLKLDPDAAHPKLAMLGDRFDLTKWSSSTGTEGFHVRPRRTELLVSEFAKQMKLRSPKHALIDIHDADPDRLSSGGDTTFEWNGLSLEVEIGEIEGGGSGLDGWRVEWIEVGPKPTAPGE